MNKFRLIMPLSMLLLGFVFSSTVIAAVGAITTTINLSDGPTEGAVIDIRYGEQNLGDGDSFDREDGTVVQWRIETGGSYGPWKGKTIDGSEIKPVEGTDFDYTKIDLSVGPTEGAVVDIRYGEQDLVDEADFVKPTGINIQWRIETGGNYGPWKTKTIDGSEIKPEEGTDFDYTKIDLSDGPTEGAVVDIRYGEQDLVDKAEFVKPTGISIQWRIETGGRYGPWKGKTIDGSGIKPVEDTDFCDMTIDLTQMGLDDAVIDIRYLHDDLGDYDMFVLPTGITIQWRVDVGGRYGPWITTASCGTIKPMYDDQYCTTDVDLSAPGLAGLNPVVDVRYLDDDLVDDDSFVLPTNITIQWSLDVNGRYGPWKSRSTCGTIMPVEGADFKELMFGFDWTNAKTAQTELRYIGTVKNHNGSQAESVVLPTGISIQAKPLMGAVTPGWTSLSNDNNWNVLNWTLDNAQALKSLD